MVDDDVVQAQEGDFCEYSVASYNLILTSLCQPKTDLGSHPKSPEVNEDSKEVGWPANYECFPIWLTVVHLSFYRPGNVGLVKTGGSHCNLRLTDLTYHDAFRLAPHTSDFVCAPVPSNCPIALTRPAPCGAAVKLITFCTNKLLDMLNCHTGAGRCRLHAPVHSARLAWCGR